MKNNHPQLASRRTFPPATTHMLLPLFLFFLAQASYAVDPFHEFVNFNNLPDHRLLRQEALWYRGSYQEIREAGRHEISGDAVSGVKMRLAKLLELVDAAAAGKDGKNIDLLLFRLLLYNDLDGFALPGEKDYGADIVSEALRIESLYPKDYRAYWILGKYYAYVARPLDAMKQFQIPVERLAPDSLPAAFWRSYAAAAAFADMPKHALEACRRCAALDKSYVMEYDVVFRSANRFRTPAYEEDIPPGSLYQFQEREDGFGLLCRLFGVYIPVDRTWGNQSSGVSESRAMLVFRPAPLPDGKGGEIDYTITVEFEAGRDVLFEDYLGARLKKYKTAKKYDGLITDYPFSAWEISDTGPQRLPGGFRGLLAVLRRPEPAVKGLAVERPVVSLFNSETGEPYYRPEKGFDRYHGDIYYVITLECSEDIFPRAVEVLARFVQGMLFD